jgi:hypothetical protein
MRRLMIQITNRASATQNNHENTNPKPNTIMTMTMNRISSKGILVPLPYETPWKYPEVPLSKPWRGHGGRSGVGVAQASA